MKREGCSVVEQVDSFMEDMDLLVDGLVGTDVENMDKEQLKKLRDKAKNFALEVQEQIYRMSESEK